ncbi:MAG: BatA domain-containing protein [Vicinamibacterales bacterium]|jgi:hypothetical protein|nr:hypothetical protein [Acidobacteriota bacterium]MDP7295242.1 BatA domain-containing protein [Vicinamibacterales bacterium]MDP7670760.1 BatA domain-containing protein [Vicinamibacterales bacterium]HJO37767.1 BatA domain-containing protein [Vicinamibacterales bacterium]|tara:strand:+ start:2655 stop:4730 length:2076 start_codon:yes stop_codon:yes gene_type:complete
MAFLAPLLLLSLAALAVPVLVHLIHRERDQIIQFPSLMFLERVPYRSMRRQKIRNWPLFLLRCAAFILLVLAFARPFFTSATAVAGALGGGREVVVLLDQSYSMGYGDRWARAQAAALREIDALGPDDGATLILFARNAEAGARSSIDHASVRSAIDRAEVGVEVTRFGPALKLAEGILEVSEVADREAILISDFQKNGWAGNEGIAFAEGVVLRPISVAEPDTSNLSVASVSFEREPFSAGEQVTASARLVNLSTSNATRVPVTLELDGREVATRSVDVEATGTATVAFEPFIVGEDQRRGTVRIGDDLLLRDNAFHFTLSPGQLVTVLIVEADTPNPDSSLYLERALAIGSTPSFVTEVMAVSDLTADALVGRSVVILNDTAPPAGAVGDALTAFVENGGGVLAILGERVRWSSGAPALLPGSFTTAVDRIGSRGRVLGYVDYSHPVFDVFNAPRSGDLSSARFFQYRPFTVTDPESVLARFDDGQVALAGHDLGRGRVLAWASTLDSYWNDLALKPVYLPFVHQLAKHLAGYVDPTDWHTTAQILDVASLYASSGYRLEPERDDPVAVSPTGDRLPIRVREAAVLFELADQGFYEMHTPGADVDVPLAVAVNTDRSESDLTMLDPEELAGAITGRAGAGAPGNLVARERSPEETEGRQGLWRYLLVVALLLLAAETVLSNLMPRVART